MGFFTWIGRVFLWIFLLPVGIWRSLVHHRKKAEDRAVKRMFEMQQMQQRSEKPPAP